MPHNKEYPFLFSILLSVYNVEAFIEEAVDSILTQSIGFGENVEIVMVDDGSTDKSGAICDAYQKRFPRNIKVIHKENGGLCSARNEGLRHVSGKYVNFFDPDDILSPNTLAAVRDFFQAFGDKTDIAAIPLYYFGDRTGPHHLNGKFSKGTRVISLKKEPFLSHLSAASSFIRHEIAVKQHYDERLVIAEDAEQIMRILIERPYLGVVADCAYHYRRRDNSQVTGGARKKGYYGDYVRYYSLRTLDYAEKVYGYIPKFVQNAVMGDLRWRYAETETPTVLSPTEFAEYKALLRETILKIDADVVMAQRSMLLDTKLGILLWKYGRQDYITKTPRDIQYGFDSAVDWALSRSTVQMCFLEADGDDLLISVRAVLLPPYRRADQMYLTFGKERIAAESLSYSENKLVLGDPVSFFCMASFRVPCAVLRDRESAIAIETVIDGIPIVCRRLSFGRFFPIAAEYEHAYAAYAGFLFRADGEHLLVVPDTKRVRAKYERAYRRELWQTNKLGGRKAALARRILPWFRLLHRKPVWIISDRLSKGGDNGEALFRYLRETRFRDAEVYYAINEGESYRKLKPLGNVVLRHSWYYKLLHLIADCIISSHADEFVINPFEHYSAAYTDILAQKKFVFLQHGVTKDDISGWLNRYAKNIVGFVCAAIPEHRSIIETPSYHYASDKVWLTGFPRFDRLYHDEKRYITLMPTWRRYLMTEFDRVTGKWNAASAFRESEYFRFYNALISNERLLSAAERLGYTVCFMPHPNVITMQELFTKDDRVKFFSFNDEYRDVYAQSDLILTDYSSAVFDFAYMRKPVVYAQFDAEQFFTGEHVYTRGYFDYERDGFGEVTQDLDATVDTLISYMESGCRLKDEYRKRIDAFFAYNDKENARRVTERLLHITKKR